MSEQVDIFDGNHVAKGSMERVAAHMAAEWHQTFHCWIVARRNEDWLLLQLRSPTKRNYPDMLDITAAGHLESGEQPDDGVRELEEELGVVLDGQDLRYLGIKHDVADEENGARNREFAHVYMLRDDRALQDYRLQVEEVSGLVEIRISDGLKLFSGEVVEVTANVVRISDGGLEAFVRKVSLDQLIPRVDPYYLKVCIMAERFLSGDEYLAI